MSLWLSARNPHNTESYHTEHPQTTSNGDPTETCRDTASHRNLQGRRTPQKPARTPHPRETCKDAASHGNLQRCRIPQKPARTPHLTESCKDTASHRILQGCRIPQNPARKPYPTESCKEAAPHRNLQGCGTPQKPARTLVHWSRKNETLLSCGALRFWRTSNKINPLNFIMIIFIIESNSASSLVRALPYDL